MNRTSRLHPTAITAAYYAAFIVLGLVTAATGPTLPALAGQTSSRLDQISIIFLTGSLGYLLGSFTGGHTYDRLPGQRVMPAALLVIAAGTALIPIVPALWMLAGVLFVSGFAQGVLDVGGNALLTWLHGTKVGPYMNGLHFFFGIGSFVAPVTVAQIVGLTGRIHWAYWIFAIFMLPVAAAIWLQPGPEVRPARQTTTGIGIPPLLLGMLVSFFFLYVGAEIGYGNWIFTYTVTRNLGSEASAAYLTSAFWGFFTLGRLAGIPISTRVKPLTILYADLAGCLLALGLILAGRDSATWLWAGTILLGISMASIFPTTMTLAEERLGLTGKVTGWFLVGSGCGGMFWPWMIGQVFEKIGPLAMMSVILANVALNLMLLVALTQRRTTPN